MTKHNEISPVEVEGFLNSWKDGVIAIGIAYQEGSDYREKARAFIATHYAFDIGEVLFKPTFAKDVVFRNNFEDALSYFVSGKISEDSGFAIKPWENIDVSNINFLIESGLCAVHGILNLQSSDSVNQTKIAFTFILVKANDNIKIKIHHSSPLD